MLEYYNSVAYHNCSIVKNLSSKDITEELLSFTENEQASCKDHIEQDKVEFNF